MAKKETAFIITLSTNTNFKFEWARKCVIAFLVALMATFQNWQTKAKVDIAFVESEIMEFDVIKKKKGKK